MWLDQSYCKRKDDQFNFYHFLFSIEGNLYVSHKIFADVQTVFFIKIAHFNFTLAVSGIGQVSICNRRSII